MTELALKLRRAQSDARPHGSSALDAARAASSRGCFTRPPSSGVGEQYGRRRERARQETRAAQPRPNGSDATGASGARTGLRWPNTHLHCVHPPRRCQPDGRPRNPKRMAVKGRFSVSELQRQSFSEPAHLRREFPRYREPSPN